MKQTHEAIEQLKEALEGMCKMFEHDYPTLSASEFAPQAYNKAKKALASLSTVEVRNVFVAVYVEDELPSPLKDVFCLQGEDEYMHQQRYIPEVNRWFDATENRYMDAKQVTHWLKPAKAIIIEQ
jgi:hypothetical protein